MLLPEGEPVAADVVFDPPRVAEGARVPEPPAPLAPPRTPEEVPDPAAGAEIPVPVLATGVEAVAMPVAVEASVPEGAVTDEPAAAVSVGSTRDEE